MSEVVGKYFVYGLTGRHYYCDSYDPNLGYWMTSIEDIQDKRINVSERAIGRTFWEIFSDEHQGSTHYSTALDGWTGRVRFGEQMKQLCSLS